METRSSLEQIRSILPNNLPGAIINSFIFSDHWMNKRKALRYWKKLYAKRPRSLLLSLVREAIVFRRILCKVCKMSYVKERGINSFAGRVQLVISHIGPDGIFVNLSLRSSNGKVTSMIGWEMLWENVSGTQISYEGMSLQS